MHARMNEAEKGKSRVGGSSFGFIPIRSTSNASLYALTRPSLVSHGSRKRGKKIPSQDEEELVRRSKKECERGGMRVPERERDEKRGRGRKSTR